MAELKKILPNFLLVGAARSGTTTLYHCLRQHPDIYMPDIKEPCFFTFFNTSPSFHNKKQNPFITSPSEYYNLFVNGKGYKAIGEASTPYLFFYKVTIKNILNFYKDQDLPKIIIILRNPIDRAYSQYMRNVRDLSEDLTFEEAIDRETNRIMDNVHFDYFYVSRGNYYRQVMAYMQKFKQIKIYLFDDLVNDGKNTLKDIQCFLEVDKIDLKANNIYNMSGKPKIKSLNSLMINDNLIKSLARPFISAESRYKIKQRIMSLNIKKTFLNTATRKKLSLFYKDDINKLEDLILKDMSSWIE